MFPIYTKTFGGKIWKNVHSVSPDNFVDKKVKTASLTISRQNWFEHHLVQKELKAKTPIRFLLVKDPINDFFTSPWFKADYFVESLTGQRQC